jgi:CBS-domain-containing membrane protein
MRARDVMSSPVVTVTTGTTVKQAAELLAGNGFTALPVLDDDEQLIGIVTEADLVHDRFPRDARYRSAHPDYHSAPSAPTATVGDVMTSPVIGMGAGTDVVDLVTVMLDDRLRSIPIVDGSTVVGIVTRRDLLRVLARDDNEIAADIRRRLANYGRASRWTVEVHDGAVDVTDEFNDATDRHIAAVIVESVPGVTCVRVASVPDKA